MPSPLAAPEFTRSDLPAEPPGWLRLPMLRHGFAPLMLLSTLLVVLGLGGAVLWHATRPGATLHLEDCRFTGYLKSNAAGSGPVALFWQRNTVEAVNLDQHTVRWSLIPYDFVQFADGTHLNQPAISRQVFAFSDDRCLYAFDPRDGQFRWGHAFGAGNIPWNWLLVDDTIFFLGQVTDHAGRVVDTVAALDGTTGAVRWATPLPAHLYDRLQLVAGTLFLTDGTLPTRTGLPSPIPPDARITSIDPATGQIRWTFFTATRGILAGDQATIAFEGDNGKTVGLYGVNAHTSSLAWELPGVRGAGLAPQAAGDLILVPTAIGQIVAVDWHRGTVRWMQQFPARALFNQMVTVGETTLLSAQDDLLRGIDTMTGATLWESPIAHVNWTNQLDAFGVMDGSGVTVFAARSDAVRWHAAATQLILSLTSDPHLVFVAQGAWIAALDSASGERLWSVGLPVAPLLDLTVTEA